LLDGSLISGSGSYSAFVTYIASLVSSYPDLFETEANWQSSVSTYGVCGKFVYDSVNNTVRLPKITGFTEGTIDPTVLGDLVQAGLPNITGGNLLHSDLADGSLYGCTNIVRSTDSDKAKFPNGSRSFATQSAKIDASLSNSIYGNSTTVQPQSIKVLYYIVIATSTKTSIEVDIDEIATDLNGKADVDLSNVNVSGTSLASGWSMPSSRYINLTLGASGATYTAPANGWFTIAITGATNGRIYINKVINNETIYGNFYTTKYNFGDATGTLPVKKNDVVMIGYDGTVKFLRFIYAEGEN
jgi:hypothetical protein